MTGEPLVLAVDCSTTASKAVAFDARGREVATASTPLDLDRPGPGRHEQDAEQWWTATLTSLARCVADLDDPGRVRALCVTHQRESFVCLDADGRPLRPAILWLDSRAGAEIAALGSPRVLAVSGKPPDTTPAIYKLAWLARHEPQLLGAAARVVEVHAFLAERLTGRRVTSTGSADSLGLLDLAAADWSPELLALAGVRPDQLPDLVPPGAVLGDLLPAVARAVGRPAPGPHVAGIADGQAAGLGAGVVVGGEPGAAYLNLGTSMVLGTPSDRYVTGEAFRTLAGAPAGTYVLETVLNAAAYLADWFRRELGDPALRGAPDAVLEAAAAALPPGADGLLAVPYWNAAQTPYWDAAARGAVVGLTGAHTRAHVYRALLEGVAFELRLHLDGLAAAGTPVTSLRAMGGGSRSPLWAQVVADVTGREIRLAEGREISARGAAALAWAAVGGGGLADACAAVGHLGATVTPRPDVTAAYDPVFGLQQQVYPRLREVFAGLAALQATGTASRSAGA
ncbi:MAG: xylulose kinase [Actinobacteria bacterium]|nr:xylulose kinase [Actinomycetota bacterium]